MYGQDGGISKPVHDIFERYVHDPNFEVSGRVEPLGTMHVEEGVPCPFCNNARVCVCVTATCVF